MVRGTLRLAVVASVVAVAGCGGSDRAGVGREQDPSPTGGEARVSPGPRGCAVTQPNHQIPPGQDGNAGAATAPYHGNGRLWTVLPDGGVVREEARRDGSIREKFPWWRAGRGRLEISGRRLEGAAQPLRARVPGGYGPTGFQSSGIIFPRPGCWKVTGSAGGARLTFVTLVERAGGS